MTTHMTFRTLLETAAGTPLPEWHLAEAAITVRRYAAGEPVFLQGVVHPYLHVVVSGLVKLVYVGNDGHEWTKSFAPEGSFFASVTALQPAGRTAFMACALEDTTLERIDHAVLSGLATRHLAWSRAIGNLTLGFAVRKEARERELLTLDAQARYQAFCADHPALLERISQKDLALHLGVTPVGLNRIVARVRRQNVASPALPPFPSSATTPNP